MSHQIQLPHTPNNRQHSYMLYPIVLKNENKNALVRHLEKNNIETRDLMPLLSQPVYKKIFGDLESRFPVAQWLRQNGFYIGCHPYLTKEDREYVVAKIYDFFK